jgi:regulatory protein
VEQVITSLREQALVDDASFARLWTNSRDSLKPRSAWAIKRELRAKGIDSGLAEEAVQEIDDEDAACRAAQSLAHRVHGNGISAFRRKLWGLLKRRGFSDSVARRVINRLWDDISTGS